MRSKKLILVLSVFVFSFTFSFLVAQDKPLTLEELCKGSHHIIIGTPVSMSSYKSDDGKHVYTDIDIAVEKTMKGNLVKQDVIRLKMYGGTINGITTFVVGFPRFALKMKSFFFLKEAVASIDELNGPQRVFLIVGTVQGKIDIINQNGNNILLRHNFPTIKLTENGQNIPLSKVNPTTTEAMISYITNLSND